MQNDKKLRTCRCLDHGSGTLREHTQWSQETKAFLFL